MEQVLTLLQYLKAGTT